jgi:hypothetical protein
MAKHCRCLYGLVPRIHRSVARARIEKLSDILFALLCDRFHVYSERVASDQGPITTASVMYILCAALSLLAACGDTDSEASHAVAPNEYCIRAKLVHSLDPSPSLATFLDTVWLVSIRWHSLRACSPPDLAALRDYLVSLVRRSFFLVGTVLAPAHLGTLREPSLVSHTTAGPVASPVAIRRICEGLIRPLATVRFMIAHGTPGRTFNRPRFVAAIAAAAPAVAAIPKFRTDVRDFVESVTLSGTDFAKFAEQAHCDPYSPEMMHIHSRTPAFSAFRANSAAMVDPVAILADRPPHTHTLTDLMTGLATKLFVLQYLLPGTDIVDDDLLAEPFFAEPVSSSRMTDTPYFIILIGRLHVFHRRSLIVCEESDEQAMLIWIDLIATRHRGTINGVSITAAVAKLGVTGDDTASGDDWDVVI